MSNQNEDDKILYIPICPVCKEIASIDYKYSFNFELVCAICQKDTLLSIEKIEYKKINEINNYLYDILNSIKDNKKLVLNKVASIKTKLNYIYLTIIRNMYPGSYEKKFFSLNFNEYNDQIEKLELLNKPSDLSLDDHSEIINLLTKIYYFHFLYKSIIKIYEKTGINIFINQKNDFPLSKYNGDQILLKFKIPYLLDSLYNSHIKDKMRHYLLSKKIYKYLDNKEYYDNAKCFSIFVLPILKYIVIGYKIEKKSDSYFIFYDYQMNKLFDFFCNIYPDNILIRDLPDGTILISENDEFSIYSLKKDDGNTKFELIQKIDIENNYQIGIPVDGITSKFLIIEHNKGITLFEKLNKLLIKKIEFNNIKQIINKDKKNAKMKGLFLNDNLLIIYYKINDTIIFEEKDMSGNYEDIKKYSHNLLDGGGHIDIIKLNLTYLLINDNRYYIYFYNYELKQIETIFKFETDSKFIFSRINQNLIFIKDNKININKLNNETLEVEEIKEMNLPNVFQNINIGLNCVYSKNKLIYSISCLIYDESDDCEKNIVKLFTAD